MSAERANWIALREKARQLCEAARDHEGSARLFYINEAIAELSPLRTMSPTKERFVPVSAEHDLQQLRQALMMRSKGAPLLPPAERLDALAALSRVGERIDAQQHRISELESLVAKSAQNADVRADAEVMGDGEPRDGYIIDDPVRAARDLLALLREMESRDLLALNREGQREVIAILTRLLPLWEQPQPSVADAEAIRDAFGELYGCGDIRFGRDADRALKEGNEALDRLLADFRRSLPESATKPVTRGPVSGAGGNT